MGTGTSFWSDNEYSLLASPWVYCEKNLKVSQSDSKHHLPDVGDCLH